MPKALKITLCIILAFSVLITAIPSIVYTIRGSLKSTALPDGFTKSLSENAYENEGNLRIMSSNLLVHYESWGGTPAKPRAKKYIEMLNTYTPDVIGIQEMSDEWFCLLGSNLPNGYKMINKTITGLFIRMTAMIYNSNTLNLIDSGEFGFEQGDNPRLRRIVWGVFESKETGKRFAVTNTHFDLIREGREAEFAEIMEYQRERTISFSNELKEKYDCPVFSTGDFNTMEDTELTNEVDIPAIYNSLAQSLVDAKYEAKTQICGNAQAWEYPSYDHIFMNGEASVNTFAVLSYDYFTDMSDHYPIIADVTV